MFPANCSDQQTTHIFLYMTLNEEQPVILYGRILKFIIFYRKFIIYRKKEHPKKKIVHIDQALNTYVSHVKGK